MIRVPLIFYWKNKFINGFKSDSIVSLVDIVPTLLDLIDKKIPEAVEGESLKQILKEGDNGTRDYTVVEFTDDPKKLRLKTVVTQRYKLTYYHGYPFGELYDLQNNPGELKNLWNDPSAEKVKCELLSHLIDHAERLEKRSERFCYA